MLQGYIVSDYCTQKKVLANLVVQNGDNMAALCMWIFNLIL